MALAICLPSPVACQPVTGSDGALPPPHPRLGLPAWGHDVGQSWSDRAAVPPVCCGQGAASLRVTLSDSPVPKVE